MEFTSGVAIIARQSSVSSLVMAKAINIPVHLPFLKEICWQIGDVYQLTPQEMLHRYERGWHYLSKPLDRQEEAFIDKLAQQYCSWLTTRLNSVFRLDQHQKILFVLSQLRASFLKDCKAYFGGGTQLALANGEYRLSQDIDFLCSSRAGYRQLRNAVFDRQYHALLNAPSQLQLPQGIQANQYGIRFPVISTESGFPLSLMMLLSASKLFQKVELSLTRHNS